MKRSRFSEEQIIRNLKEHQAGPGAKNLCRKHGVSDATFYERRSKYGGMKVPAGRKLLAEPMMGVSTLNEVLGKTY